MAPALIIPAAGIGSRLGATLPKVLVPVAGVPMLDRLLDLYSHAVEHVVVVVGPGFHADVEQHLAGRTAIECVVQHAPTGMLDAILLATPVIKRVTPSSVWVTWCDQVAVHPRTIARLQSLTSDLGLEELVFPTVTGPNPYIHFERDAAGRIVRVLHRREGDEMPAEGESDMGLFAMSADAYLHSLPRYAAEVEMGKATGERNFLPFIPWLARRGGVTTFPATNPMEAIGVNTVEELEIVERYLRQ